MDPDKKCTSFLVIKQSKVYVKLLMFTFLGIDEIS